MNNTFRDLLNFVLKQVENRALDNQVADIQIRKNLLPEELRHKIDIEITANGLEPQALLDQLEKILAHSVTTNHPFFMNQMFGKVQPIAFLADILLSVFNTSMYTYEVAPVLTLIEKETIQTLAEKVWGTGIGDGVITAGGSMANMKAILLARQNKWRHSKKIGLFQTQPVAIFVSEQAHYSFNKAVNLMGLGTDALYKIPSDAEARIIVSELEKTIESAEKEGKIPLMLTAVAGTTISGTYDDIAALAKMAQKHQMWFHVDAAFGGALLFSEKEKFKLNGIEQADSVTWNFHKAMGMPLSTSSFLTKEKGVLNKAFHVSADYLFHSEHDDYDLGQKSMQGGRRPDVFKLWLSLKYEGLKGFEQRIDTLRSISLHFAEKIKNNTSLQLFQIPDSTIVCFRYYDSEISDEQLNKINTNIREEIFNDGKIIFNYAPIHNIIYLRCVLTDPDLTESQLDEILTEVLVKAALFIPKTAKATH